jgi:hypothetical protein
MFALISKGLSLLWTEWRVRLMGYHAHALNVRVDLEGPPLVAGKSRITTFIVPDWMKSDAVSTGRWSGWFVLVALKQRVRSRSRLAKSRSSLMQVVTRSLRRVVLLDHWLWRSGRASLILCRLAGRDPMQLGAAILHVDWLDGRTVRDWHLE